jgi:hypothetical protein
MPSQKPVLTPRQEKWFATVQANFEAKTGKPLAEWQKIIKKCPETKPRAQAAWLKENYGIGINHASYILSSVSEQTMWEDPDALLDALWKDAGARKIYEAVAKTAAKIKGTITGPRKTFVSFARNFQYAAIRPVKLGVRLGFALPPSAAKCLSATKKNESWSERLKSALVLSKVSDVDAEVKALLKQAFNAS